VNLTW